MEASAEQTAALKQRIRRLERALAESEALTLAQIECTQRLEQQLQEQQQQLDDRDQQLQRSQSAQPSPPPSEEQHIQELQDLIWELERRPTLEQHHLLKQQCENHQLEIATLKLELQRRPDPVRIFELQQEIAILKEYTQHLTDRSTNVMQVQQKYLELRSQYNDLEAELERLRQQALQEQGSERLLELESKLQSHEREFSFVLAEMETLREQYQQSQEALESLQRQYQAKTTENQELRSQMEGLRSVQQDLTHWKTANQQLSLELASTRYQLEHLRHDHLDPAQLRQIQDEKHHLQSQLETLQALQQQHQAELQQQKLDRVALQFERDQAQAQIQELQSQLAALQHLSAQEAEWQAQLREAASQWDQVQTLLHHKESHLEALHQQVRDYSAALEAAQQQLAQLPSQEQWQDLIRQRELVEAHHVVNKKQIEQLQQHIAELKTECVQTHATVSAQEKEIALLEDAKRDLELRLYAAQNHPHPVVPQAAPTAAPAPTVQPYADGGIPPFSVDATVPPLPRGSQSAVTPVPAGATAGVNLVVPTRARVELPAFVRRR